METVMSDAPVNTSPKSARPGRAQKLKAVSMFRLLLGRPRLPIGLSRTLGWLVFVVIALLPLCLAAGTVLYLHSSLWPTNVSEKLSKRLRLHVSVARITDLGQNWMQLEDVTIRPDPALPVLLHAERGSYHPGDQPTLSLTDVQLHLDLDWWSSPETIPEPERFTSGPSQPPAPVLDLRNITVQLTSSHCHETLQADVGLASLKEGLLKLQLVSSPTTAPKHPQGSSEPSRSPAQKLLVASLGYQHGKLIKQLTLKQTPPELIRACLRQGLGKEWASAFVQLAGELTLQHPADGTTWLLDGSGSFETDLLEESVGLSGLEGRFQVQFRQLSGSEGYLRQGVFEVTLLSNGRVLPNCSVEALKGLQLLATATEPLLATGVDHLPFDRAGVIITITPSKVYVSALRDDKVMMSNADIPILVFDPQEMTRQELHRRLLLLKALWAQLRVS